MTKSVLLVHADTRVQKDVRTLLAGENFKLAETRELSLTDLGSPDAALIAWEALRPVSDSLLWLKRNAAGRDVRVIVLADQADYSAAVRALEYGADDCIRVPLNGDELLVRLNACLSRPQAVPRDQRLTAGPVALDRRSHRVWIRENNLELAPTEFRLLAFLLENQGRVFSRNELLARAWSSNVRAGHRTVDVHVRRLRQQLEPFRCEDMIQTVRGFGYRLRADEPAARA
ncbi:MAG TPA: winged helix-turn-helix domain-containing protein [Gammaproteobacteria bacterium]|nr:winged helix-turn-helix domain-containing protein [Gammaproteobacteria bacterium]